MGSSLRRQLREVLPAEIKGLQRAIALEIADDARYDDAWRYDPERGRCSKARLADLVRWTGAKDELSVREMLRRMAVAGWEFRVSIGKGKDGRPLYAVPGRAMQFRVPDFEGPTTVGPFGGAASEGPTVVEQGPTTVGEGPTVVAEGPTTVGSPSQVLPPTSHKASPSSSPAEPVVTEPAAEPDVPDGGGGGVSDLRSIAEHITASLDYQGQVPDKQQLQALTAALVAVLEKGWTIQLLAPYLRLGSYRPGNPVAFYLAKLTKNLPDTVPTLPSPARGGVRGQMPTAADYESLTVDSVFFDGRPDPADGGMWERSWARAQALSATLNGGHQPYQNPPDDSVYDEPWTVPPPRPSWCGEPECEPIGRMREHVDASGLKRDEPCPRCHPDRARAA